MICCPPDFRTLTQVTLSTRLGLVSDILHPPRQEYARYPTNVLEKVSGVRRRSRLRTHKPGAFGVCRLVPKGWSAAVARLDAAWPGA